MYYYVLVCVVHKVDEEGKKNVHPAIIILQPLVGLHVPIGRRFKLLLHSHSFYQYEAYIVIRAVGAQRWRFLLKVPYGFDTKLNLTAGCNEFIIKALFFTTAPVQMMWALIILYRPYTGGIWRLI